MYIIIFIIILAALVFVHELGHFLVAKASGIRVDEFALGFPPRIFSFQKGETRYSLNAVPFGGYVKIFGEDYEEAQTNSEVAKDDRSFINKPRYIQATVLIAGICFNIIFAWLLLSLSFMIGMPAPEGYQANVANVVTTVISVDKNSPAEQAGLSTGDHITALSAPDQTIQNPTGDQIQNFTTKHANVLISMTFEHGGNSKTVSITPTVRNGIDHATIGISMEALGSVRLGFFSSLWEGGKLTATLVSATAVGIVQFIGTAIIGHAHVSDVTGPVGIARLVGDATQLGFTYILSFTAFISINLAIINLVPFPALDGGRILFVLIEKIRGKALNTKAVQIVNMTGLGLLLLLMLIVTYHDIATLLVK
jgi:regulator of sigma E protease